jgi:hypothetical protein
MLVTNSHTHRCLCISKLNRLITQTKYKKTHIPINAKNNQYVNIRLPFLPSKGDTVTLLASFQTIVHFRVRYTVKTQRNVQRDTLCERQTESDLPARGTCCVKCAKTCVIPQAFSLPSQKYKVHRQRIWSLAASFKSDRVTTTFYIWPGLFNFFFPIEVTNLSETYPSMFSARKHFRKCKTIS